MQKKFDGGWVIGDRMPGHCQLPTHSKHGSMPHLVADLTDLTA